MTAAVLERARPATGSRTTSRRPKLRVLDNQAVRQRARRRNALFVLFVIVLLGFFAVAFVHAELVAGQQDLDAARARIAEAEAHKAKVARAAEEASSPQQIVKRAEELGMVRAYQPVYLEAVSPQREVPIIAALAPAASRPVNQIAATVPGVSAGISGDATVLAPVPDRADLVAIGPSPSDGTAPLPATTGTTATPTPTPTPMPASAEDGPSLGGTSIAVAGRAVSGASVSSDGDSSGAMAGTSVSSPGVAGAGGVTTSSSIAGSRAVAGGLGEGSGSG